MFRGWLWRATGSTPGVVEINGVKVGVTICYDIRFPELYRKLAWDADCDLILHPSAFIRDATFPCYHQFVTTRAVENGVYLLSVNYAGEDFGDSIAVPPWVGPVPGLIDEGDDQGGAYGHDEGVLSTRSLGIEEGVLPLLVQPFSAIARRCERRTRTGGIFTSRCGLRGRGDNRGRR